jgi:(p)ppGpp synthase/HD superfamily hydrolase
VGLTVEELGKAFEEALGFALRLHAGQRRKGRDVPYAAHLLGVTALVLQHGGGEEEAVGALLHDAVEDQGGRPRLEEIRVRFGERVAEIVDGCSDSWGEPKPPWRARKEAWLARVSGLPQGALLVAACDKLENVRALCADLRREGPVVWARFNGGREIVWYYRAALAALRVAAGSGKAAGPLAELALAVEELAVLERSGPPVPGPAGP